MRTLGSDGGRLGIREDHAVAKTPSVLWSLVLASEAFHDFFASYFGGKEQLLAIARAKSDPSSVRVEGEELRLDHSAKFMKEHGRGWSGIWHPQTGIWSRKTRPLERRNSRLGCRSKFCFFHLCFSK